MINNCTGLLSNDHISILQELAVSYAHTTRAIKVSFADTCAILSKFVVKAYHVMKHSMNKKDEETLQNFEKTLKIDVLNQFNSFENSSRNQLIEIHSKLLIKAHGAKMKALLKQRTEEETKVETKAEELKKKYVELSIIQTNIESLRYNQSILEKAMNDSEKAKKYIEVEIQRLENQISSYEQKLLDHRNTRTKEYRKSWIYSWKIRDVIKNNGESIARENLYRLLDRIRTMKHTMKYWSNENVVKRLTVIKYNLTRLLNDSNSQEKLYKKYNESYNQAETKFFKIIKEIESIEETTGTVNVKSMEAIDRLARAVQSGQESFVDAYSAVRRIIGSLDLNPDLLTQSILYALQFLRMGDDYMKTTRIDDIRRLLGIV
ncbi:hypothetical protein I4U23_016416 [Adineta vaga]|nr:hypothetical protein I4U23_016416 [Adineta vaga]